MTARALLTARAKTVVRQVVRSAGYDITPLGTSFTELQRRLLRRCDLVVDVGANTGQYGELVRSLGYPGRVVSFEPQRAAFEALRRRARTPLWEARRLALADAPGTADLRVSANSVSSSLLDVRAEHVAAAPRSVTVGTEVVELSTVDLELAAEPGTALWLKLDVQGAELDILRGGAKTLRRTRVVQSELSLSPLYDGQTDYLRLCESLQDAGLRLCHLQSGFQDPASGRLLQMDGLFVRSDVDTAGTVQ